MGGALGWTALIGGIALAVVILWAILRNRADPRGEAHTEAATKRLYDEAAAEDHAQGGRD